MMKKEYDSKTVTVMKNSFATAIIQGGSLLVSFAMTPAFIRYFGNQTVLGIWYKLLSVISWIVNFDLGIGNGLRNRLAVSYSEGNEKESKELISSAYTCFGLLIFCLIILWYYIAEKVNWKTSEKKHGISICSVYITAMIKRIRYFVTAACGRFKRNKYNFFTHYNVENISAAEEIVRKTIL